MSILCLHQSAELYGSDRSFLSAIEGISKSGVQPDIILPFDGALVDKLNTVSNNVSFYSKGVLRKQKLKKPFSYFLEMFMAILFYIAKYRSYNLVYINTIVMLAALVAAIPYRFSKKRIICHVREIPSKGQLLFFRALFRLSNVELIFNSQATREAFSLPGSVIYNGVDDISEGSQNKGSNISIHSTAEELHLLLIGRINTWKGQDFLLHALAKLPMQQRKNIELCIVGSPFEGYEYLEDDLVRLIEQYELQTQVKMIPFCSDPSIHYHWADYVVVPSTKPEPFGRVAVEAFAGGKPVIAANHGGLTEIVTDTIDGYLFHPCDDTALATLISKLPKYSSREYEILSSNARQCFESRFSAQTYQSNIAGFLKNECR